MRQQQCTFLWHLAHTIDHANPGIRNMIPNQAIRRRRSIRLQAYDYATAGAYFVTICCQNRACFFGEVVDGELRLNAAGQMVQKVWDELPDFYPGIGVDASVVMPNHFHGIIVIGPIEASESMGRTEAGQTQGSAPTDLVGSGQTQGSAPTDLAGLGQTQGAARTDLAGLGQTQGAARTDLAGLGQTRGSAPTDLVGLGQTHGSAPTAISLFAVVQRFKSMTTMHYIDGVRRAGWPRFVDRLWQRNYYERVVRNDIELAAMREYVANNPLQWLLDRYHPENLEPADAAS